MAKQRITPYIIMCIILSTSTLSLANNSGVASTYSLTSATLDINAKPISLSGSKVFDASATASSSALNISGTVGGQTLTLTGNGTLTAGANVGTNKAINTSGLTLGNGSGGTAGARDSQRDPAANAGTERGLFT